MKNFAMQKNLKITTILTFTIMALFLSTGSFAQDLKVLDVKGNLADARATEASDLKEAKNLISQLYPTMYLLKGKTSTYGETSAMRLETDIQGLKSISSISSKLENVKIAKIVLNNKSDLIGKIDTADLASIPSLRYVYIVANVEAKESQIASMIVNTNPDIIVLFSGSRK
jgi:hypothetical protein